MGHVSGPTTFKRQPQKDPGKGSSSPGGWKKWAIVSLSLVILLGAGGGGVYGYMQWKHNSEIANVRQLMEGAFQSEATEEERREQWGQIQEARENLTEEQRRELDQRMREERMRQWEARETERIAHFHTLSAEDQTAYLDEQIDQMLEWQEQMEERRREWEQRRQEQGESEGGDRPGGERRGGPPRGGGGDQPAQGGQAGGGERGDGQRPDRDNQERQERRQQFRRERLSDTSPEQRAQWANYREKLRQRMEERGIEGGGFGGPGRRGPR